MKYFKSLAHENRGFGGTSPYCSPYWIICCHVFTKTNMANLVLATISMVKCLGSRNNSVCGEKGNT